MKTFIGIGQGDAQQAVKQATNGLTAPNAIIFITPYEMAADVAARIKEQYPDTPSMGTIGTKLVNGQASDENIVVLGLFDDVKVSMGVMEQISRCPVMYVTELERKISSLGVGKDDTVCIEYCTGEEEKLVTTFTSCLQRKGIHLAGGTAFGVPDGKNPIVAYDGKVYEDACVYAFIKNTTGKVRVYKENIYEKHSSKYHFATKVDVKSRSLIELDGKPAAEVYSKELNVPKEKIAENVILNPMGRAVGNQVFISSIKEVDARGALINYKCINKNDCIYFLDLGDYKESESRLRELIRQEASKVSFVFSVDCAHRYLLYNKEGYFDTYVKDMASLGKHIGIIAGGEQYNNQHVNQTMVCVVFE